VWRVLPACVASGNHPLRMIEQGWAIQQINELAATWEIWEELRAQARMA